MARPTCSARSRGSGPAAARSSSSTRAARRPPIVADEWVAIQPGTDAAWLLAITQRAVRGGRDRRSRHLADIVEDVDAVREACREFTPESVEALTRVPAETTRRIAREIAAAEARVHLRPHRSLQPGVRHARLVDDRRARDLQRPLRPPRHADVRQPRAPAARLAAEHQGERALRSSAGGRRACGARPRCSARCRARASPRRSPRPARVRSRRLICVAGNPVISVPDSDRLDAALPMLECDDLHRHYLNETTRHAHVILPGPSPIESPHFDDLLWGLAARSAGKWSEPVFPLDGLAARGVGGADPSRTDPRRSTRRRHRRRRDRRRVVQHALPRPRASTRRRSCRCTTTAGPSG